MLDVSVNTGERFSATAAYAELVFARLAELREQHVDGYQRLGVFIERRFRPAIRFCAQASRREIEDYRLMALISLPLAQDTFARCSEFETRLQTIVDALGKEAHQQERLLKDLAQLA
ncbi:DUF3422 family protein, partial [Klebsiella pneumoniae subsp. pneumoniae]